MKSIVMENNDGQAVLFREDGTFETRAGITKQVGSVIGGTEKPKRSKRILRGLVAAAAALIVTLGAGTYAFAYDSPYYCISLDVNPSIQMEANIFGKIIDMKGLNEDGAAIAGQIDYKHQNAEKVLTDLIQRIGDKGYLSNPKSALLIATASKDQKKAAALEMRLQNQASRLLNKDGFEAQIVGDHYGYDMVLQAKAWGMTAGRYNIITHLLKYTISNQADADKYANMSIQDLMDIYHQSKDAANTNNDQGQGPETTNSVGNDNVKGSANSGNANTNSDNHNANGAASSAAGSANSIGAADDGADN